MKRITRLLPVLALLAGAALVQHADAATTLTVNCTFTISKDVTIVWGGTGGITGTGNVTWPIGAATLNTSYSTVDNASSKGGGAGWPVADGSTLLITNNSLTGDGVDLSVTASTASWTAGASAGVDTFVAAVVAAGSAPANTAALIATGGAKLTPTNAAFASNVLATASTSPLWFAVTLPVTITTGGGSSKTIAFVFTGTAH